MDGRAVAAQHGLPHGATKPDGSGPAPAPPTKTAAREYADRKADAATRIRRRSATGTRLLRKRRTPRRSPTLSTGTSTGTTSERRDEAEAPHQLKRATDVFGDRAPQTLQPFEIDRWRGTFPPVGSLQLPCVRQVSIRVTARLIETNPAPALKLKRPRAKEFLPFESWEQVEAVVDELEPRYRGIPIVLSGTGSRPEEAWALERRDLDLDAGVLTVSRVFSGGQVKEPKTERSRRRVPLRARVVEALRSQAAEAGHAARVPGSAWRSSRRGEVPRSRMGACTPGGRPGASPRLRLPSHVRQLGDRRRRSSVRVVAGDGNVRGAAGRGIRASDAVVGGARARTSWTSGTSGAPRLRNCGLATHRSSRFRC